MSTRKTTRHGRGFTLLEILTGLAILGVMTSLSVVSYRELVVKRRESNAIREIYAAALEARQRARVSQQPVRVVVHSVVVAGRPGLVVRWERPACEPGFEPVCPTEACGDSVCGENGCVCDSRGPDIAVPPTLDLQGLTGLCFLGGSGRPRGLSCDASSPPVERVELRVPHRNETQALLVEPLTGLARLEQ